MISKLTRKLYKTYYANGHARPFLLNIDLEDIKVEDIKKNAGRADTKLLNEIASKPWKLVNKSRKIFKVSDDKYNFNIQFREAGTKHTDDILKGTNKAKLAKYVFSGIAGVKGVNTTELPIMNLDLETIPKSISEKVKTFKIELDPTKKYSIEITEHFFKMSSLDEYLKSNNNLSEIKNVLFYIFYTLLCYRHIYPKFEHNGLTLKNIFVYCIATEENTYKEVNVDGVVYVVPNKGCELKLTAFEDCNIEGTTSISKDVNSIIKAFEKFEHPRLKEFLQKVLDYQTYREILYDSFFDEFKKPAHMHSKEIGTGKSISDTPIVSEVETEGDSDSESSSASEERQVVLKVPEKVVEPSNDSESSSDSKDDDSSLNGLTVADKSTKDEESTEADESTKDDGSTEDYLQGTEISESSESTEIAKNADGDSSDSENNSDSFLALTETEKPEIQQPQQSQNGLNRFGQLLGGEEIFNHSRNLPMIQSGMHTPPSMGQNFSYRMNPLTQNKNIGYSNMNQSGGSQYNQNDFFF